MDRAKLFAVGTALVALAVLFAFFQGFGTGLFGILTEQTEQVEADEEEAKTIVEQETVSAGLSFEVLRPTSLEAIFVGEAILPDCPKEAEIEILVKNEGDNVAEKMYLSFGPGIKVIGCNNCALDEINPGQEVKAKARLCLESASLKAITIGSANSNTVEILFG